MVAFDKTGTLTFGTPQVTAVETVLPELSRQQLYAYAAGAELRSEHPLGKAVVRCYQDGTRPVLPQPENFQMLPARGVRAVVEGRAVTAGNRQLLQDQGIPCCGQALERAEEYLRQGCTVIYIGLDGALAGFLALADTLRPDAANMVRQVQEAGAAPVLLTGDHENAARSIARQAGIHTVQANCLPEDKLKWIGRSQSQGRPVCMVGDGINDAPALKTAYVGIAMGGVGSDIAVDAADIALVNDDIRELPHLLRLAKRMMVTIQCNLSFSMALNFVAILLAMTGILNPVVGALVHNAGSVLVIVNSAFLLKWKKRS